MPASILRGGHKESQREYKWVRDREERKWKGEREESNREKYEWKGELVSWRKRERKSTWVINKSSKILKDTSHQEEKRRNEEKEE